MIGTQRVIASVPAGVLVPSYRNDGYRITTLETTDEHSLVEIEIELAPALRQVPFATASDGWESLRDSARVRRATSPRAARQDPFEKLARSLTKTSSTREEAVQEILGWVARNIDYQLDRAADQDPSKVLERRSAYCTGIARLSVALLASVNIESREVFGYLLESSSGSPAGYHRWIEVHYPGLGWRFSDPMASLDFVSARYLRLDPDGVGSGAATVEKGRDWTIITELGPIEPVRTIPRLPVGVQVRDRGGKTAGARLSVASTTGLDRPLRVELAGAGWVRSRTLESSPVYFLDLPIGDYTLLVHTLDWNGEPTAAGSSLHRVVVRLDRPVHYQLIVPILEKGHQESTPPAVLQIAGSESDASAERLE